MTEKVSRDENQDVTIRLNPGAVAIRVTVAPITCDRCSATVGMAICVRTGDGLKIRGGFDISVLVLMVLG
jgi:hypothetical protein